MSDTARIDKYLWAVRVFKTRTEATDACKGNKVKVDGVAVKPSRPVKVGNTIEVRKGSVQYIYKVKALLENRVGARLVPEYAENLTPQSELDKLRAPVETFFLKRDRGMGRPTKKDRRDMDVLWEGIGADAEEIPDDIIYRFGLDMDD
ncbi:MAG: RNA-binding S4 domain-containing protein [Candidatus Cryptobacteroides sp.]|nr:RNA-binding S4 domain-containing protein [Bacteroidales bacterium]